MSYLFRIVFTFVVVFLVIYNGLRYFPAIAHDPQMRTMFKVGVILFTGAIARAVFKTVPKAAPADDDFYGPQRTS